MSFSDWIFYQRVTENIDPSNIVIESEIAVPLVGNASLYILDRGAPAIGTVVCMLNPLLFDNKIECGRIHTLFKKKTGSGFEDQGLFFLSQGSDPTRDNVALYAVYYTTGSTTVRLMKYPNGLHNFSDGVLLHNYTVPFSGSTEPVALEVEWQAGLLNRNTGYTQMQVRYGSNTLDFGNLLDLTPVVHDITNSLFTGNGPGVFVRSRHQSEPLNSLIDNTAIYRSDVT